MYQRIMNRLDIDILGNGLIRSIQDKVVYGRIQEIIDTLDGSYGELRTSKGMGGYILMFDNEEEYNENILKIMKFYNLDSSQCEYSDMISEDKENKKEWWEELYLLSSDDSLVFVYPKSRNIYNT